MVKRRGFGWGYAWVQMIIYLVVYPRHHACHKNAQKTHIQKPKGSFVGDQFSCKLKAYSMQLQVVDLYKNFWSIFVGMPKFMNNIIIQYFTFQLCIKRLSMGTCFNSIMVLKMSNFVSLETKITLCFWYQECKSRPKTYQTFNLLFLK